MSGLQQKEIRCPYCGESIEVLVDVSAGDHAYIEDCTVCCRPIELQLVMTDTEFLLEVHRDDD